MRLLWNFVAARCTSIQMRVSRTSLYLAVFSKILTNSQWVRPFNDQCSSGWHFLWLWFCAQFVWCICMGARSHVYRIYCAAKWIWALFFIVPLHFFIRLINCSWRCAHSAVNQLKYSSDAYEYGNINIDSQSFECERPTQMRPLISRQSNKWKMMSKMIFSFSFRFFVLFLCRGQ